MKTRAVRFPLLLAVAVSSACATKSDVDSLRGELASLRAGQDEIVRELAKLEQTLSTELEDQRSLILTTRGDLRQQLDEMERELVAVQELLGQSQIVLRNLRERLARRQAADQQLANPELAGHDSIESPAAGEPGPESAADARALYDAAIGQLRRGARNTARTGFEEFLLTYPADELAPDAQFQLAGTYEEEDAERAIREYVRVVELYPNSRVAPRALYKAGLLEVERGNKDTACRYFQRVLAGYPRSDEFRLASDRAERLSCR